MIKNLSKAATIIDRLYLPFSAVFFLALLYNHFQLITYPLPLDFNEPAMLAVTATIADGENPYSLENQPAHGSGYPVLYNIVAAVLSHTFGNTFLLHRVIVAIFILASCALTFFVTNKMSHSPRNSFAASTLLYAGLLYYASPIASPTSLGLFLFLSSLFIPLLNGFSNRSLIAALVLGVLAFYGKQYFVASLGYISLYLFIAVSKKRGLAFFALSLILFAAVLAVVNQTSPFFLDNTVFAVQLGAALFASNQTMLNQLFEYGQIYLPLLIILAMQWVMKTSGKSNLPHQGESSIGNENFVNLASVDAPLLNRRPDYIWYCFACSLVVIVFAIGRHPGNHLSYLFQILSPFFLAGVFISLSKSIKWTWLYQILVFAAFFSSYSILSNDFTVKEEDNWKQLEKMISAADTVYASPIVVGEIVKAGGEVFNNGHTSYFSGALGEPAIALDENTEETVAYAWEVYVNRIHSMIAAKEFDLIILDTWWPLPAHRPDAKSAIDGSALLKTHYKRRGIIPIFLANRPGGGKYTLEVWEPIHTPSPIEGGEP